MSGHQRWAPGSGLFTARPRLMAALAVGIAVGISAALLSPRLNASASALAGWGAFCVLEMALTFRALSGKGPDHIRERAAHEDQGKAVILLLILTACAASLVAVALELSQAKAAVGLEQAIRVGAAVATIALSWLLMQVVFALHYAHTYYSPQADGIGDAGGLAFPGGEAPDYWDFLHFSIVIGVACQTADIAFTSRTQRRLGTLHGLIAFAFNTMVVALAINLVSALI